MLYIGKTANAFLGPFFQTYSKNHPTWASQTNKQTKKIGLSVIGQRRGVKMMQLSKSGIAVVESSPQELTKLWGRGAKITDLLHSY